MCYISPWEVCTMPISSKHLKKPCHYKSLFILFNSAFPAGIWPWNTSFHVVADNVLWNKDSLEFSYRLRRTFQRSCKHFDTTRKFCGSKTFQADLRFHVTHLCRIVLSLCLCDRGQPACESAFPLRSKLLNLTPLRWLSIFWLKTSSLVGN